MAAYLCEQGNPVIGLSQMPSRGSRMHAEFKPYQPRLHDLEKLAPSFGLGQAATIEEVYNAIEALLGQAKKIPLPEQSLKALEIVDTSYKRPAPGCFVYDAHVVTANGHTLKTVQESIIGLRRAVDAASSQQAGSAPADPDDPVHPRHFSITRHESLKPKPLGGQTPGPVHISNPLALVEAQFFASGQSQEPREVVALREALEYLVKHGVIPPTAREDSKPLEHQIARHGVVFIWKEGSKRYDPRLNTNKKQSLFTASAKYFDEVLRRYTKSPTQHSPAKIDLLHACMKARAREDAPASRLPEIHRLRAACAEAITLRPASEAAMLRWEALYRFLKATDAFNDKH